MSEATILLVEDEPLLRRVLGRTMQEAGYAVLQAGDGLEALSELRRPHAVIDLVITDIRMPNMDGDALVRRMRLEKHEQPVIYISGFTGEIYERGGAVLLKPFGPMTLLEAVARALGTAAS